MNRHIRILAIILAAAIVLFGICAFGLTVPEFKQAATISGLVLAFVMTAGFFYATLHLSKTKEPAKQDDKAEQAAKT